MVYDEYMVRFMMSMWYGYKGYTVRYIVGTRRFISCHVMAGCNHRFINCHGVVRSGLPTVYDGYMVWYAVDF